MQNNQLNKGCPRISDTISTLFNLNDIYPKLVNCDSKKSKIVCFSQKKFKVEKMYLDKRKYKEKSKSNQKLFIEKMTSNIILIA